MKKFNAVVEIEIKKAIPSNWNLIPNDKLLGAEPFKVSYAFNSSIIDGKSKLMNILVLEKDFPLNEQTEKQIFNLRNYIISKDCILIVIGELEEDGDYNEVSDFISESLMIENQNYYSILCSLDEGFTVTVEDKNFEDLNGIIHDIWSGNLRFAGPGLGNQKVNLEIMKDKCWKCNKIMKTVSGIVFPDVQLDHWDNIDWQYYNQLVPLSEIETKQALIIKTFVDNLRVNDNLITPVDYRYSNTAESKYWAAICPHCNSLRGSYYVTDFRMEYLHDLESRINKDLQYYSIELNVDYKLLEVLSDGYDLCPHTCFMGWEKN